MVVPDHQAGTGRSQLRQIRIKLVLGIAVAVALQVARFPNQQRFDYTGLEGRLLSSSYAPAAGHPEHAPMVMGLRTLFDRYSQGGEVVFPYETRVYYAQLKPRG